MKIKQITDLMENFAPLELQEAWDNCGFQIDTALVEERNLEMCHCELCRAKAD
jgi:putative NIF3 family GTP cyclohydrolase 1 type 2